MKRDRLEDLLKQTNLKFVQNHAPKIASVLMPHIESVIANAVHQEKINLIGFCKRRADEHRKIGKSVNAALATAFDSIAKELNTAETSLDALYQFEAGQKDGEIAGWDRGIDKAVKIVDNFLKTNGLENEVQFADIFQAFKEAKHGTD